MVQLQEKKILSQEKKKVNPREEMRSVLDRNKQAGEQAVRDFWDAYSLGAYQGYND